MPLLEEQDQLSFMRKLAELLSFLLYNLSITGRVVFEENLIKIKEYYCNLFPTIDMIILRANYIHT